MKQLDVYVLITPYIREIGAWLFLFLATIGGASGRNVVDDKVEIPAKKLLWSALLLSFILHNGAGLLIFIPYVGAFINKLGFKAMIAVLWGFGSQEILKSWTRNKVWSFWDFITRLKNKEKDDKDDKNKKG